MELTVLLIPLFYSGPRQNHRLTANFDMFKLTIFIIVGHQRTVLHVVNVGYHADVRIGTKRTALVHKKSVRNGRTSNAYWTERAFADNLGDFWNYYLDQI